MSTGYDKYYQQENLFGDPYPELIAFFKSIPLNSKVLDLGCGQGRDAIAIASLGFEVAGIDNSKVGIEQMNLIAQAKKLNLTGIVADIYAFDKYDDYDFILMDSMFHFAKNDKEKEVALIQKILRTIKNGSVVVICIQDSGNKLQILNETIDATGAYPRLTDKSFTYTFEDQESGHKSKTAYQMVAVEK